MLVSVLMLIMFTSFADWYYFVRIIDETHHDPGLPVQIFFETMAKSPRVLSPGDIMQFQNVTVLCKFISHLCCFLLHSNVQIIEFVLFLLFKYQMKIARKIVLLLIASLHSLVSHYFALVLI